MDSSVRENVVSHSKKRKKSCFLDFEKNVRKRKKTYVVSTGHLITQPLITQLPEVITGESRSQHQISCSEVWTQETMQLRTVCDKRLYVPITSGSFEAKISIDIQETFFLFCNNVSVIEDKIVATDFLRFFQSHFKKT